MRRWARRGQGERGAQVRAGAARLDFSAPAVPPPQLLSPSSTPYKKGPQLSEAMPFLEGNSLFPLLPSCFPGPRNILLPAGRKVSRMQPDSFARALAHTEIGSHPLIKHRRLTDGNFLGPLPALPTRLRLPPGKVILIVKQWRGCIFGHVFLREHTTLYFWVFFFFSVLFHFANTWCS